MTQAEVFVQLLDRLDEVVLLLLLLVVWLALFLGASILHDAGRQVNLAHFELEQALVCLARLDAQVFIKLLCLLAVAAYALLDLDSVLELRIDHQLEVANKEVLVHGL